MIRLSEHLHSIILVADASESARSTWQEINQVVQKIMEQIDQSSIYKIYFLGGHAPVTGNLYATQSGQIQPCGPSLLAPIVSDLQKNKAPTQIGVIVGSGRVFDLEDVIGSRWVRNWIAIQVGKDSLLPIENCIPEYDSSNLGSFITWMDNYTPGASPAARQSSTMWFSANQHWDVDRAGFPLVFIESLAAWVHLFPVFKPQYEAFLATQHQLGDSWYQTLLELNPRLSFNSNDYSGYEKLILTGILAEEIAPYSQWLGPDYRLPTIEEWRAVYRWFMDQPPELPPPDRGNLDLADSARRIWERLVQEISPQSLLDISLMNRGVIEWLKSMDGIGLGRTRPSFRPKLTDPLTDEPTKPIRRDARLRYFGFRLIRREG